jgi:tetratricopeptide (TPR) repeat protein
VKLQDKDQDFKLMVASCLIRLQRYEEAVAVLETVLQDAPEHVEAMYQLSFCRRAAGNQRDAIEQLTKIIAINRNGHSHINIGDGNEIGEDGILALNITAPANTTGSRTAANGKKYRQMDHIHRVYEMRGTLFHEMQGL